MVTKSTGNGYKQVLDGIEHKTLVHGDNTLMVEFRLKKGARLPLHSHLHEQTGYLVTGRLRLTVGENRQDMLPGDSWCIAGDVPHGAECLEETVAIEVFSPVREDYLPEYSV